MGQLHCYADDDLEEQVDAYAEKAGYDSTSKAVEDLVQAGLRETRSPVLVRLRERAIEYAGLLAAVAVVFAVGGVIVPSLGVYTGVRMAIVLLAISTSVPAGIEVARVVRGTSALGEDIREVLPR